MNENPSEEELEKIINSKKCKSVKINGKNYYISKKVKEELKKQKEHKGGFAFLAAIPAIIGALAGTAVIASGIASTVTNSRNAIKAQKELDMLDKKGNEVHKGSGIYLNPYQGTAIHKYLKNIIEDDNMKDVTRNFKDGVEIIKNGNGLYLNPYKSGDGLYLTPGQTSLSKSL